MTALLVVPPPNQLHLTGLGDGEFYQAAWVLDQIRVPFRARRDLVILDVQHPSNESTTGPVEFADLLKAANLVLPNEVIIPDVFGDSAATIKLALQFIKSPEYGELVHQDMRFMFVPHGSSFEAWIGCLKLAITEFGEAFDTVGIPKVLDKFGLITRQNALNHIPTTDYQIHMLGCWNGYIDMYCDSRIRSWDTSLPIAAAQAGIMFNNANGTWKGDLTTADVDPEIALANVEFLRARLNGHGA